MTTITALALLITVLVIAAALVSGASPERWAAGLLLIDQLADLWHFSSSGQSRAFATVSPVLGLWDAVFALAMIVVCVRANRVWVLFLCSAQIVVVLGHLSAWAWHDGAQRAYWTMTQVPLVIQIVALAWGVRSHASRFKLYGPYRSWRVSVGGATRFQ